MGMLTMVSGYGRQANIKAYRLADYNRNTTERSKARKIDYSQQTPKYYTFFSFFFFLPLIIFDL